MNTDDDAIPDDVKQLMTQLLGNDEPIAISRLRGGHHALYIVQDESRTVVLKIMENGIDALARELAARRLFASAVPMPPVVASGMLRGTQAFAVLHWVEGISLSWALLEVAPFSVTVAFDRAGLGLGHLHRRAAQVDHEAAPLLPLAPVMRLGFGAPGFAERLLATVAPFRAQFGDELIAGLASALMRTAPVCARYRGDVVTCHGDYQPKNLLFAETGDLVSIIDWELAGRGSRLSDLAHLLRYAHTPELERSLGDGYAAVLDLDADWKTAARCYDLARVAIGLSHTEVAGDSDVPRWVDFMQGCVDALLHDDLTRYARTTARLLARDAMRFTAEQNDA